MVPLNTMDKQSTTIWHPTLSQTSKDSGLKRLRKLSATGWFLKKFINRTFSLAGCLPRRDAPVPMIRIPSARRHGLESLGRGWSMRNLLRLTLLLVLGVVVARAARRETIYEPFLSPAAMADDDSPIPKRAPATESASETPAIDRSLVAAIESALPKVTDGSVMRRGDAEAYYLLLSAARIGWRSVGDAFGSVGESPATGALPLLQQPNQYLGRMVRVRGTVAASQRIDASAVAGAGVPDRHSHFRFWIRPRGGAERPIVVAVPTDSPLPVDAPVEWVGVFLKRLAYQSGVGADLAPLIIASPTAPRSITTGIAGVHRSPVQSLATTRFLASALAVGALGVALAWWLMRRDRSGPRLSRVHARIDFAEFDRATDSTHGEDRG